MGKTNHDFGLIGYMDVPRNNEFYNLPWLAGSTDGIAEDKYNKENLVVLEVKCPLYRKIKFGKCPEYYFPQVQLNMAILNIDKADFIEYKPPKFYDPSAFELNVVRIQRDHQWFSENIPILRAFWKEVLFWRDRGIESHPDYNKYHRKTLSL